MWKKLFRILLIGFAFISMNGYGSSNKLDVGPFTAIFTINTSDQLSINVSEPLKKDEFNEYGFQASTGPLTRSIKVTVDDYKNGTDISETNLMNLIIDKIGSQSYKINWNKTTIGGIPGIVAKIRSSGKAYYIAAYSPDGKGNEGKIIVFVESFFPQEMTDSFLHDLRISRIIYFI